MLLGTILKRMWHGLRPLEKTVYPFSPGDVPTRLSNSISESHALSPFKKENEPVVHSAPRSIH